MSADRGQTSWEQLAILSHEFRTPLTSVIGYAEVLLSGAVGPLTDEQSRCVKTILDKGGELKALVDGLLELASGVRSRTEQVERVDVSAAVRELSQRYRTRALDRKIHFEVVCAETPLWVVIDRLSLSDALEHLVGNAMKFTASGGSVSVDVASVPAGFRGRQPAHVGGSVESPESWAASKNGVVVTVSDSGIGIPHELQARVFEPFVQADGSLTREFGGIGLGLALVRHVALRGQGEVWLESTPGQGSKFTLWLPLAADVLGAR